MKFRLGPTLAQNRKAISLVLALIAAAVLASSNWREQKDWLGQITLEVQTSSAPNMGRSTPTRAALWLQTTDNKKNVVQSADWTSATAKPLSRLRFDFPAGHYERAVFFPDPALQTVEVGAVRLIRHGSGEATDVPLDRVQSQQPFVTSERTQASIIFQRPNDAPLIAIALGVTNWLEQKSPTSSPRLSEAVLVFLAILLTTYACALFLIGLLARAPEPPPSRAPLARFGIILGLVACMAAVAPDNSHPDEFLHVETARYYLHHWLPPALDNEWVVPTFSHYGLTYLVGADMGYIPAAKFALFCQPFFPDLFAALRFFNVALLVFLLLWSARVFRQSTATWLFLLTPQLWYVFAAYNTEGWALFVSWLLMGQIACNESSLHDYLTAPKARRAIGALIPALSLASLLLVTKKNFLFVFLFFVMWLIWNAMTRRELRGLHGLIKILPLILIPLLLRFGVQTYQNAVNHNDLPRAVREQAEKYAQPEFKPSAFEAPGNSFPGVRMKEQGVTLQDVLIRNQWLYRTTASFFGTYGWMTITSSVFFYFWMGLGWAIFIGCALVATFTSAPKLERIFNAIAWLYLPLIVAISAYYSWIADFQAQGRYLFPFLAILFYLIYKVKPGPRWLITTTVWGLFLLSVYSFIFVGFRTLAHP